MCPLWYQSAVLFFHRHPCFWNFNPAIPLDIVRMMSNVNSFFYLELVASCAKEIGIKCQLYASFDVLYLS